MKASIAARLGQLTERLEEVTQLLAQENATRDMELFRKLTREHAELTPVVEAFAAYRQCENDLATAEEMLADPDMKEFAQAEIDAGRTRLACSA